MEGNEEAADALFPKVLGIKVFLSMLSKSRGILTRMQLQMHLLRFREMCLQR